MRRRGFTPVPLAFLALAFLAAGLLLVGYGVPVGIGLLVGLVFGVTLGAVGLLWLGGGPGRSIGPFATTWLTSSASEGPVELPDWVRDSERVTGVDIGPLRRILVVGQTAASGGASIELTTIELRDTGGVAIAVVHTAPPDARSPGPFARVTLIDDVGTTYVAAAEISGSAPFVARLAIRFAPAPPIVAARLTVRIEEFADPFSGREPRRLAGPWSFVVPLEGAADGARRAPER
ncbi:MAG: hypothetical protein IVW53_10005 [Chloroflexi bacterium]|nr:hypothetical protein [Chloroflexota bacterium]